MVRYLSEKNWRMQQYKEGSIHSRGARILTWISVDGFEGKH